MRRRLTSAEARELPEMCSALGHPARSGPLAPEELRRHMLIWVPLPRPGDRYSRLPSPLQYVELPRLDEVLVLPQQGALAGQHYMEVRDVLRRERLGIEAAVYAHALYTWQLPGPRLRLSPGGRWRWRRPAAGEIYQALDGQAYEVVGRPSELRWQHAREWSGSTPLPVVPRLVRRYTPQQLINEIQWRRDAAAAIQAARTTL